MVKVIRKTPLVPYKLSSNIFRKCSLLDPTSLSQIDQGKISPYK